MSETQATQPTVDIRAAVLAEMESGAAEAKPEAPKAEAAQPAKEAVEAASPAETTADSGPEPEPASAEAKADDSPLDPETAKRIAAVSKAEKRSRDQLSKERTELQELKASIDRERMEIAKQLEEVKAFAGLKAKAKYAPAEVLAALGLTEDDYEPAARDIYARSKAAAIDPKNREAAARMQAQREYQDRVGQLESRLETMQKELVAKDQQVQYQQAWHSFYGDVVKSADKAEDAPLLRSALAKNPARTQQAIQQTAADIYKDTGEWPDPQDVIVTYEKLRRQELEDLGVEYKPAAAPAAVGKPSKTVSATAKAGAPSTPVNGKRSRREEKEDILAALERGQLE